MLQGYVGSFCHIPINKKKKKEKRFCLPSYVCGQESPLDGKARRACAMKSVLVRGQDEGSALTGEIHRKLQRN